MHVGPLGPFRESAVSDPCAGFFGTLRVNLGFSDSLGLGTGVGTGRRTKGCPQMGQNSTFGEMTGEKPPIGQFLTTVLACWGFDPRVGVKLVTSDWEWGSERQTDQGSPRTARFGGPPLAAGRCGRPSRTRALAFLVL